MLTHTVYEWLLTSGNDRRLIFICVSRRGKHQHSSNDSRTDGTALDEELMVYWLIDCP
jgi:hypothetical protein